MKRTTALVALLAAFSFALPAAPVFAQDKGAKKSTAKKPHVERKRPHLPPRAHPKPVKKAPAKK